MAAQPPYSIITCCKGSGRLYLTSAVRHCRVEPWVIVYTYATFSEPHKIERKIQYPKIEWEINLHACQLSQNSKQNPTVNFFRGDFSNRFFSLCMGSQFLSNRKHTKFELFEAARLFHFFKRYFLNRIQLFHFNFLSPYFSEVYVDFFW